MMRRSITRVLILMVASLLVGNAVAGCAMMSMPCCAHHQQTTCHTVCASTPATVTPVIIPQPPSAVAGPPVAAVMLLPVAHPVDGHYAPTPSLAPENLLSRLHVLLI